MFPVNQMHALLEQLKNAHITHKKCEHTKCMFGV